MAAIEGQSLTKDPVKYIFQIFFSITIEKSKFC